MPNTKDSLKKIVSDFRKLAYGRDTQRILHRIPAGELKDFAMRLGAIDDGKYAYKEKLFPDIPRKNKLKFSDSDKPTNLPEAFIWKQSDWKKYKKFRDYYNRKKATAAPKNRIVHYAFALHLQSNGKKPIFDQHSCRALLAILEPILDENFGDMETFLFVGDEWRGDKQPPQQVGLRTFELFADCVSEIAVQKQYRNLDCLLMPLGQALKKKYKTKTEFYDAMGISL